MTIARHSRKGGPMLRWSFLLLLGILAVSLVATSTVHAREFPGMATIECSGVADKSADESAALDMAGDADEAPAGKSPPPQHATCHAPATSLPEFTASSPLFVAPTRDRLVRVATRLPLDLIRLDIRPPIA
jgi:hypothetical protein